MSKNTRKKLDRMTEIEQRNQQRLAQFKSLAEDPETEHKRECLAKLQAGTAKPGMEHIREAAIARYMHELKID